PSPGHEQPISVIFVAKGNWSSDGFGPVVYRAIGIFHALQRMREAEYAVANATFCGFVREMNVRTMNQLTAIRTMKSHRNIVSFG
ncbi:MAG: hypothetical protein AB7N71_12865, partial [Phycisphaerae bacterium]